MSDVVAGSLVYQFKADIADLKSGFANIRTELDKVKSGVSGVNDNFKKLGDEATKSIGLNRNQMIGFAHEIRSAFEGIVSGQSILTIFAQQGAKIATTFGSVNGGASAAVKQLSAALLGLAASPVGIALTLAGAIGGIAASAYSSANALEKLSGTAKALGTNSSSLKEFNRQLEIIGVDSKDLNQDMVAFAQRIREAQIAGGDLADKLNKVGINIKQFDLSKPGQFAELFAQIAEKVRNGSTELDKLNAIKFLGLSEAFLQVAEDGKSALDSLAKNSQGAAEKSTKPIEEAWRRLREYISDAIKYISDEASAIADKTVVYIVAAIDKIAEIFNYAKQQLKELKSAIGMGSPFPESYSGKKGQATELSKIDISGESAGNKSVDLSAFSTPKAKSSTGSKSDPLKTYIDSLKEAAAVAKAEANNWALGNVEKAKAEALAKAEAIALNNGKTITDAMKVGILQYAEGAAQSKQQVDNLKAAQQGVNQLMSQFADTAINAFEGLMDRSKKFSDVLRDIVKQLSSGALKGLLTGEGAFGQLSGLAGQNGEMGGLLGAAMKSFSSLPKFATGGSLGSGQWGIAGEAGPELVQGPATMTPFGKSQPANIQIHNYAGAKVETQQMSDGQIMVLIKQAIDANNRRVPGIVADAQRRSM